MRLPIVNGYVVIPGLENHRSSLTPDQVVSLIPGAYQPVGTMVTKYTGRVRNDRYIILPAYNPDEGFPEDWWAILRAAA